VRNSLSFLLLAASGFHRDFILFFPKKEPRVAQLFVGSELKVGYKNQQPNLLNKIINNADTISTHSTHSSRMLQYLFSQTADSINKRIPHENQVLTSCVGL